MSNSSFHCQDFCKAANVENTGSFVCSERAKIQLKKKKQGFKIEIDRLILKSVEKYKEPRLAKEILRKEKKKRKGNKFCSKDIH